MLVAFAASLLLNFKVLRTGGEPYDVRIIDFRLEVHLKGSLITVDVDVLFFEPEIFKVLIEVLCGTFATKIYSLLHQGRCGPAVTWAEID